MVLRDFCQKNKISRCRWSRYRGIALIFLHFTLQPGGAISEKVTFDMHTSDLVADLRAEISMWWEGRAGGECGGSMLGSLLVGPALPPQPAQLRLISQGQEITPVGGDWGC